MIKATEQWNRLRHAVLEQTQRHVIEPLRTLCLVFLGACVIYLAGFSIMFQTGQTSDFSPLFGLFIVAVASAGTLIPFLTGAVLMLYVAE